MRVYKFGGASIADPAKMAALLPIIADANEPLLVVLSALGKTTNALEHIVNLACRKETDTALAAMHALWQQHLDYAKMLLNDTHYMQAANALGVHFGEMETAVLAADPEAYDYTYDQVVSIGELLSSGIFAAMLNQHDILCKWVDIRRVLRTDDTYRDAVIDWPHAQQQANSIIGEELRAGHTVVTQGFIGATSQGKSVTLGREGSDYTAAVLAAMLGMQSVTIWKDVTGLQNADPKLFSDTVKIDAISYNEVIEMAFYGAQIIHPKTIKPLQNSNIPLYVKCFLDRTLQGSVVKADVNDAHYPPLIVLKDNQVLIQVTTRDFSFITEDNLSKLYSIFHDLKIKINLIQNAAISFVACIDDRTEKVKALIAALGADYRVAVNENVHLLTVRHGTPDTVSALTVGKEILLRQETRKTVQAVMK